MIQTFTPNHYAIRHGAAQDYAAFFAEEIRYRRLLQYPPFTHLAVLVVARPSEAAAQCHAEALAGDLANAGGGSCASSLRRRRRSPADAGNIASRSLSRRGPAVGCATLFTARWPLSKPAGCPDATSRSMCTPPRCADPQAREIARSATIRRSSPHFAPEFIGRAETHYFMARILTSPPIRSRRSNHEEAARREEADTRSRSHSSTGAGNSGRTIT